jgi:hypothetical protein
VCAGDRSSRGGGTRTAKPVSKEVASDSDLGHVHEPLALLEIRSDLLPSTLANNIYELSGAGVMLSLMLAPVAMATT